MNRVRLARIAEPYWKAIPEPERERIEGTVPDGEYLAVTVPMTRGGRPTSFRARIYSEFTPDPLLLVEGEARGTLYAACWDALGRVA